MATTKIIFKIICKSLFFLSLISAFFVIFYKFQKAKIYKLDTIHNLGIDRSDSLFSEDYEVFVVQNPPDSKKDFILLVENFNRKNGIEKSIKKNYTQAFYEENIFLNRFYEPHSVFGTVFSIANDEQGEYSKYLIGFYHHKIFNESERPNNSPTYELFISN